VDPAKQLPPRLKFGGFEADVRSGELTQQGKRLPLQEQPFRLLVMLLERPGELVTREEVRRRLWPHAVVDFDHGVNKAISKIRDALGDSAEKPRFVETVARHGYRFLADVTVVSAQSASTAARGLTPVDRTEACGPRVEPAVEVDRPLRRRVVALRIASGATVALLLLSSWIVFRWAHSSAPIHSIAVLPLENLSGDASQEYFADGMTDELITQLGQIKALRVISRTSVMTYKTTRKTLADIARELDVQAVVEGSVLRVGDGVRITAQLIRVPADEHLWAHSYEGNVRDTLALQSQVSEAIAGQILNTLSRQEKDALAKAKTVNPEAYEAYLKGRYFWNKRDASGFKKAIEYFQLAIAADPSYAQAYSGLADAYATAGHWVYGVMSPEEALPLAKAAATQALLLNPTLSEGHTSLAFALDQYSWDWQGAGREFRRAIELNPGYATAHHWYAYHLVVMGDVDKALAELRAAENLDPLSLVIVTDVAELLYIAHRFDDAMRQTQKALDMDANFALAHDQMGQVLAQKQMFDGAIAEFQRAIELSGHSPAFDADLAHAYAVTGHRNDALRIATELEQRQKQNGTVHANIALVYLGLGNAAEAMKWLEKAYDARFNPAILVRPEFDPLRSDPQFKDLVHRLGLDSTSLAHRSG
jgi:TolB-like protein/DNA-binding winged helix-turn-helix (wHTH) protein/Flp pilus assembly protein TadD